jgi:hypothetical protein
MAGAGGGFTYGMASKGGNLFGAPSGPGTSAPLGFGVASAAGGAPFGS